MPPGGTGGPFASAEGEQGPAAVKKPGPANDGASLGGGMTSPFRLRRGAATAKGAGGPLASPLDGVVELAPKRGTEPVLSAGPGVAAWIVGPAVAEEAVGGACEWLGDVGMTGTGAVAVLASSAS